MTATIASTVKKTTATAANFRWGPIRDCILVGVVKPTVRPPSFKDTKDTMDFLSVFSRLAGERKTTFGFVISRKGCYAHEVAMPEYDESFSWGNLTEATLYPDEDTASDCAKHLGSKPLKGFKILRVKHTETVEFA